MKYTLSEKEELIISIACGDASLPAAEIAARSGISESSVRYHLRSLAERNIIRCTPLVNVMNSGYSYYTVYFSLMATKEARELSIGSTIIESPECVWFSEMGGDYHYGLGLCMRHPYAVDQFLKKLCDKHQIRFFRKVVACQIALSYWGRNFIGTYDQVSPNTVQIIYDEEQHKNSDLDEIDRKILAQMTGGHFISRRKVASILDIPLSTVDFRVRKLEQENFICGYVYEVSFARLARQEYKLLMETRGEDISTELRVFGETHPALVRMYTCLGPWDFDIVADVKEVGEISAVTRDLYAHFGDRINNIKVLPKFNQLKASQVPW